MDPQIIVTAASVVKGIPVPPPVPPCGPISILWHILHLLFWWI